MGLVSYTEDLHADKPIFNSSWGMVTYVRTGYYDKSRFQEDTIIWHNILWYSQELEAIETQKLTESMVIHPQE